MTKKENNVIIIKNLLLNNTEGLSLADRRLYNYLLHHAFDQLLERLQFSIPFSELHGIYSSQLPSSHQLQASLKRLMKTLIEFQGAQKKWVLIGLLAKAEINEIDDVLYYEYPKEAKYLFTNPFTLEKCLIQAHFTLKYSNLLYEILALKHYANESIFSIDIIDLRNQLHILTNKFINFSDFKRFVLTPAINEINSYASFIVKYQTQRKGMKVTHLTFELITKRNIDFSHATKTIIPEKRPRLFIDNPQSEKAYAYLLNAETKIRRHFFDKARKLAYKQNEIIAEEDFDRPDLWFKWVEENLKI